MSERIVLGYSGGLDTSIAIPWLKEKYGAELIAVVLDLGQGGELNQIRERAIGAGAARCHVLDAREEFARDYILPALQADALHQERHPLATALGRPLIARKLVEIAHMENASAIAHGCSGTGRDQARIDVSARAIDRAIAVLAPVREWAMSAPEALEYARDRHIAVPPGPAGPYRVDRNLWGRTIELGPPGSPWTEPPDDIYTLTKPAAEAPDAAACVEIEWQNGVPVSVSGVEMPLVDLIGSLETIAGVHGVGRIAAFEDPAAGVKPRPSSGTRRVYEAPAAALLHTAHRELERLVVPRELHRLKHRLAHEYADLVDNGLWFSPTRPAIDAFVQNVQQRVTGTVRLQLFKGDCRVVARTSPFAVAGESPAVRDEHNGVDQGGTAGAAGNWRPAVETGARSARRQHSPVPK